MKMIIAVTLALVAVVSAAPVEEKPIIETLRYSSEQSPDGSFSNSFENSDGTKVESIGELKQVTNEDNKVVDVLVQRGSYVYPGEDGKPNFIEWVADEQGFRAQGDSIPKVLPSRR